MDWCHSGTEKQECALEIWGILSLTFYALNLVARDVYC